MVSGKERKIDRLVKWLFTLWPKPKPSELAIRVKESREYLGMDQQEAADMMGIPVDELRRFEAGLD